MREESVFFLTLTTFQQFCRGTLPIIGQTSKQNRRTENRAAEEEQRDPVRSRVVEHHSHNEWSGSPGDCIGGPGVGVKLTESSKPEIPGQEVGNCIGLSSEANAEQGCAGHLTR